MNGVHDMGGMHGFGPIAREANEPVFHEPWEGHVRAMMYGAMGQGVLNVDEMRHAIERMAPADYLTARYYERWLSALERLLVEKDVLDKEEIEARMASFQEHPEAQTPRVDDPALTARLDPARKALGTSPHDRSARGRFRPGDRVVARNLQPKGHTRLPRYVRGKHGVIERFQGAATLPDASAHGPGHHPEPLYNVRFEATELWGSSAEGRACIHLDLWESYLDQA